MERYEFSDGKSSKFWEVEVSGRTLTVCFGRIGTQGQSKLKEFADAAGALKEMNRLVKEKTGKGYQAVRVESVPDDMPAAVDTTSDVAGGVTATLPSEPAPNADAGEVSGVALSASVAPGKPVVRQKAVRRLIKGTPFPTRMRPGPKCASTGTPAWEDVTSFWRTQLARRDTPYWENPAEGLRVDFRHRAINELLADLDSLLTTPLETVTAELAAGWLCALDQLLSSSAYSCRPQWNDLIRNFFHALAETIGPAEIFATLVEMEEGESCRQRYGSSCRAHLGNSPWDRRNLLGIGLREVVVNLSAEDYQRFIEAALRYRDSNSNLHRDAFLAFVLADDRPDSHHALQVCEVLKRAVQEEAELEKTTFYLPLFAEAPSDIPPEWPAQTARSWYFPTLSVNLDDILATTLISADAGQVSALPVLALFMAMAGEKDKTSIAMAILDTQDSAAVEMLCPLLDDKWVRAAFDKALDVYPEWMFGELLQVFDPACPAGAVKTRLLALCQKLDIQQIRVGADAESLAKLDALLLQDEKLATEEDLPAFLRNPPWLRSSKKAGNSIVLQLKPVVMPFSLTLAEAEREKILREACATIYTQYDFSSSQKFLRSIEMMERELDYLQMDKRVPVLNFRHPVPGADASEQELADFVEERVTLLCAVTPYYHPYIVFLRNLILLPEKVALQLWKHHALILHWHVESISLAMCVKFGEPAFDGFLHVLDTALTERLADAKGIDSTDIVPYVIRAFVGLKKSRAEAAAWFRAHPRTAVYGILPRALGSGTEAAAASLVLRWLADNVADASGYIQEAVAAYAQQDTQVVEAVRLVLEADPLDQVPAKLPKLPAWYVPANFSRPQLKAGGALPDAAVRAIGEMLAFRNPDAPYAGIAALRDCCTAESLGVFAWDVFSQWLAEGAAGKENWALRALGWFGGDEAARRLTPLIRKWPGEAAHARAVTGLEVLADIGSDLALTYLNGIAEKLKFKGLQEKAREKIAAIAQARDLSAEELADRLVPDFDLDARGGLDLDFGPRQFRVGFDEFLKPWVKDSSGVRLKDLPKPNKADDAGKASEAAARWSALKKDVRAVASLQLARLEALLTSGRRIRPSEFALFFARHPLIRNLVQRLVWGEYADALTPGRPLQMFRMNEELDSTDAEDNPVSIDFSSHATTCIGLVHPLQMNVDEKLAWGQLFGDYEIAQPFPQIGRETYALTDGEAELPELLRFRGSVVEAKRLRGMGSRGWRMGSPQDGGCVCELQRRVYLEDGRETWAVLGFGNGLVAGGVEYEDTQQTLETLILADSGWAGTGQHAFSRLAAISASELLRDLSQLVDASAV